MYQSRSIWEEIKWQYNYGGIIIQLIFVNIALYVLGLSFFVITFLSAASRNIPQEFIEKWLYVPSGLVEFLTKPWTLISYQFLHAGFWHILFNMLVLYWFGRIFTTYLNPKKILPLYLLGGFAGALFFLLSYNIFPAFRNEQAALVGASASIMAILGATTALAPDYEVRLYFLFNVKLKFIAAFLIFANIFTLPLGNAGGNFAHLGGVGLGFLYIYLLRRGTDITAPINKAIDWVIGVFTYDPSKSVTFKTVKNKQKVKASTIEKEDDAVDQDKVDAILDKIAENGYDSLTKEEKAYLFKASKN